MRLYRKGLHGVLAVAVLGAVGLGGLGLLSYTSAGDAPGTTPSGPTVESRQQMIEDREEGELLINGQVVVRIRTAVGGVTASERAQIAAQRLQSALQKGARVQDLAVRRINQQVVIVMGDSSLITVDELHAAINGTTPERLAEIWLNQIREALGVGLLHNEFGSPFDATALAVDPSQLPITWRTIQNNQEGYWKAQAVYPKFGREPPQEESALIRFANTDLAKQARSLVDEYVKQALDTVSDRGKPKEPYPFDLQSAVALYHPEVISVLYAAYSFSGGAHGMTTLTALNYALVSGQPVRLQLQDLFKQGGDAPRLVSDLVIRKLKSNPQASFVQDGTVRELNKEMLERFVIHPDALIFLFQHYEIAPYAAGNFMLRIPFSELADQLNPQGPLGPLLRESTTRTTSGLTGTSGTPPEAPLPSEPLADKFVPILSVGQGARIGVARVSGPKSAVDMVRAVAQIEGEYQRFARGRAFVPVATENVLEKIERVAGVNVTGYADLRF